MGYFQRRYDYASSSEDYGLLRADTLHQIYMPKTIGGWLNVTLARGRTFYATESNGLGSTKPSSERYVVHTGVEVSTKLKMMPELNSRLLGIDTGARHIIQPSINFAFIPAQIAYLMNWISLITKSPAHAYYHWNCPSITPSIISTAKTSSASASATVFKPSAIRPWSMWWTGCVHRLAYGSKQQPATSLIFDAQPAARLDSLYSNLRYDVDNSLWRAFNQGINLHPQTIAGA